MADSEGTLGSFEVVDKTTTSHSSLPALLPSLHPSSSVIPASILDSRDTQADALVTKIFYHVLYFD